MTSCRSVSLAAAFLAFANSVFRLIQGLLQVVCRSRTADSASQTGFDASHPLYQGNFAYRQGNYEEVPSSFDAFSS